MPKPVKQTKLAKVLDLALALGLLFLMATNPERNWVQELVLVISILLTGVAVLALFRA